MVGHIQNDSILSTTTFSLRVELGSNQPPFGSDSSKTIEQSPAGGRGQPRSKMAQNGGQELASSACACGSVDRF